MKAAKLGLQQFSIWNEGESLRYPGCMGEQHAERATSPFYEGLSHRNAPGLSHIENYCSVCHAGGFFMKRDKRYALLTGAAAFAFLYIGIGCVKNGVSEPSAKKSIVVTYPVIAPLVEELAGEAFAAGSIVPNGTDPHEWSPSAKDTEKLTRAALVVVNGLGFESGMEKALRSARENGVRFFTLADHVDVRKVGKDEGIKEGDPGSAGGADDPHIWTDPVTVKKAILALGRYMSSELGIDTGERASEISARLDALDASIRRMVESVQPGKRMLVTGHESLGYFARAYGFKIVGAVVPSLTTQAEESASDMRAIRQLIDRYSVMVIFTELGTPSKVTEALARETGARVVRLSTHVLPKDLSYYTFMEDLATAITESLR